MIKIDIFSGFLGAGKTTLIKKLIKDGYENEKVVLIENEFGEIGIDGGFLADANIEITEMNSGCICCSLVGDFSEALKKVIDQFSPERIIIEPSGVGKLSDIVAAVKDLKRDDILINGIVAVVDALKCKMYMKNFGEFFNNQIENAKTIVLSHTGNLAEDKIQTAADLVREHNKCATLITTDWDKLSGCQILSAIENEKSLESELEELAHEHCHHHEHNEECGCGHHHHEHHEECGCGHHHHEHHEECGCGHHHHDHDADEVFSSWGCETVKKFEKIRLEGILKTLYQCDGYGVILRAKGIVDAGEDGWLHFDFIPGEVNIRQGSPDVCGKICVIGSKLNKKHLEILFLK